jgi:hypothetical protein
LTAGPPARCVGVMRVLVPVLSGVGQHLFMVRGSRHNLTSPILVRNLLLKSIFLHGSGSLGVLFCPVKGGVDSVRTYVCFMEDGGARVGVPGQFAAASGAYGFVSAGERGPGTRNSG